MHKYSFFMFLAAALAACQGGGTKGHGLKGKWNNIISIGGKPSEFIAHFRPDGTYDGILDGKVLVSGGSYRESGDTVFFTDAVCNSAYAGTYLVYYYEDSVKFRMVEDSCTLRRNGTDG